MTLLRSKLGMLFALAALATPQIAEAQSSDFQEGVQLLQRGRREEALAAFQRVLAADLSNAEAYELWKSTEADIFTQMLVAGGQFQLIAKRVIGLAKRGRAERKNDEAAIKDLVQALRANGNVMERRRIIRKLSADHGEYAVPYLIRALTESGDDDWRVTAMNALTDMSTDVVPPLIEALATDDPFLRRNVALVLGYVGDPRAAGILTALAGGDPDGGVVAAASGAATRCGSSGDALALLLKDGDDYHHRRDSVLRGSDYSDVVWNWGANGLVSTPIPRSIYSNEMSRRAYQRALRVRADSLEGLAGIARACIVTEAKLTALAEAGEDVAGLAEQAAQNSLAVSAAGTDALDLALQWSVATGDSATGVLLIRALADLATAPTQGLLAALASSDGAMRGEAAVALARVAFTGGQAAGAPVVAALGASAGREIVRIAAIIDSDAARAHSVGQALDGYGVHVNYSATGANGLTMLYRVPGLDVVLVGDRMPDLTIDQVISAIHQNPATAETPIFLVTSNESLAESYGDRVTGVIPDAGDLSGLSSVFDTALTGDRAEANDLSRRASEALGLLAGAGHTDLGPALGDLAGTLASRPDSVTIPAMIALGGAGNQAQIAPIVAVVTDAERSDEARIAAADALRGIFGRQSVTGVDFASLGAVLASDASFEVQAATSRAIGRLQLSASDRAGLILSIQRN